MQDQITVEAVKAMSEHEARNLIQNLINGETALLDQYSLPILAALANRGVDLGGGAQLMKDILAEVAPDEVWPRGARRTNNPGSYMEAVYNWGKENGFEVDKAYDPEDF